MIKIIPCSKVTSASLNDKEDKENNQHKKDIKKENFKDYFINACNTYK